MEGAVLSEEGDGKILVQLDDWKVKLSRQEYIIVDRKRRCND